MLKLNLFEQLHLKKVGALNVYLFLPVSCILVLCSCFKNEKTSSKTLDTAKSELNINHSSLGELDSIESEILKSLGEYLNSRDTLLYYDSPLWSEKDKVNHLYPDFEIHSLCYRTKKFTKFRPSILSLQKVDSAYILKILFSRLEKNSVDVMSIYNVVAAKESGKYVFHTYSDFFKRKWNVRKVNNITFYFDSTHLFNNELAKKFDQFNVDVANKFEMKPLQLKYFLFANTEDRLRFKGYDFDVGMFETIQKSAEVDSYNNIIYAGNGTEFYPHEIIHFYTFSKFGNSLCHFFDEGIATLLGGNINPTFKEDVLVLKEFVKKNTQFDFSNLTEIKEHDGNTNFRYTIAAILCNAILAKGGQQELDNALKCGNRLENIYAILNSSLGVKREGINNFIKVQLDSIYF